ncbi:MAG: rhomboid family intramembrane serine protease [Myxococcota bacterium]|nr:rhomboid family intramembrane serine protease [Myxococcota bacterium]
MQILCTRSRGLIRQFDAILLADGLDSYWQPGELPGTFVLDVPASEAERIALEIGEVLLEDLRKKALEPPPMPQGPLFLQPAFTGGFMLAALMIVFYWFAGGSQSGTALQATGRMVPRLIADGDWWRLVTAGFLHGDLAHISGNAGFLLVFGWAAAERVGAGMMLLSFVVTSACGMAWSALLEPGISSVGASAGVFGLLGLSAGDGVTKGYLEAAWKPRIRAFGAPVMLLAFTAFDPESNVRAHVAGFVAGLLFGALLRRRGAENPAAQFLAGAAFLVGVALAWQAALRSGPGWL